MITALCNIGWQRDPTKDPVTRLFEVSWWFFVLCVLSFAFAQPFLMLQIFLVFLRVSPEHATFWVQPVSFVFVGILAVSSVRGFLGSISNLIHFSSGGVRSSTAGGARGAHGDGDLSTLIALLLGFVMGTYFVSTLLLIRMSVPEKFRGGITRYN